jgi:hypothetical protein
MLEWVPDENKRLLCDQIRRLNRVNILRDKLTHWSRNGSLYFIGPQTPISILKLLLQMNKIDHSSSILHMKT